MDRELLESLGIDPAEVEEMENQVDPDAEPREPDVLEILIVESSIPEKYAESDLATDYRYTRNVLYTLSERTNNALAGVLRLAATTDHPRAYQIANDLIRSSREITVDLMNLQNHYNKVKKETSTLDPFMEGEGEGTTQQNNTVVMGGQTVIFKGDTAQLQAVIASMQKQQQPEEKVIDGVLDTADSDTDGAD